jgi:hypothetical protein
MKGKKHYAYKTGLTLLWQTGFYLLVMTGAAYLVIGSNRIWDKALVAVLVVGAIAYAYVQVRRFFDNYYVVGKKHVMFVVDGRRKTYKFSDLEDVQFDSSHMTIQLVFNSGFTETHREYSDLRPLTQALDNYGIRVEYRKMGK